MLPSSLHEWHHAYLVEGGAEAHAALREMIALSVSLVGNPDLLERVFNTCGVDEARDFSSELSRRPLTSPRRICIVRASAVTSEAQNALLKTLEEPLGHSVVFLVVPHAHALLPTLRSRMQGLSTAGAPATRGEARKFLAATESERLAHVGELLEKDEALDQRDLSRLHAFLDALERELGKEVQKAAVGRGVSAVYRAKRGLLDGTGSLKSLLEQVALLLPRF